MDKLFQYVLVGSLTGLVYSMVALSFMLVYRASGIFNFAQGGLVVLAGYLVWWFHQLLGGSPWPAIVLAMVVGFSLGMGIERVVLRPLISQPTFSLIMMTIGLLIALQGTVLFIWGGSFRPFPRVLAGPAVPVGPFLLPRSLLIGGVTALVIILLVWQFFERTTWGMRLTAVAESHVTAQSMGISPQWAIALSWGTAMALSVWGAVLLLDGRTLTFLVSEVGFKVMVLPLLSGLESVPGLILSGVIVGVGEALAGAYLDPYTSGGMSTVFPFLLILVTLLIRPQGLFGWRIIERV